ncbi:uncharacterized protein [Drosophila pseudoobscura]|uniref:Uncharacterized protein isoform X1 n=1 Tax=Drosophila pseudoobscura pseudoobscura TaxID=46245 RepID=A0A6I8W8T3_DROPS|nr:uncharacterized protein LOC6899656 isoform X1 [Drosophila pseudoobscura]
MAASKVPDWINAEIFEDVLKSTVPGYSKVKTFKADSGSAAGENYATIMLRVNIEVELEGNIPCRWSGEFPPFQTYLFSDGKAKDVSYMVKLPHQLAFYQEMMKKTNIFDTERLMYNDVVPEMEALYKAVGVDLIFGARSYDFKGAKSDYVLLEDLSLKGFKNANRLEGLDQTHTERVLKKLAQWHAASAVRVATKGSYPEMLTMGFFKEESKPMMTEMINGMMARFLKVCVTFEGHEEWIEQIKALIPASIDEMYKMAKIDPQEFNVLNHGDSWSNNIMFQYDAFGTIKEVYLVDYQIPKYGTVAQDLLYFLLSSTRLEDKLSKFDYYIKFYHDSLIENLKILKYTKPLPTLRSIHLALLKYGVFGYSVVTGVMSGVLLDPTENASLENFVGDSAAGEAFQLQLYTNPRYRKHIQAILPWLLNRGALEISAPTSQ